MPRLLFEKTGKSIWMSHLDLMRLFQRAFKRAGFTLKHTQGFNPRPSVSIALPLSVGVESKCELLDFEIDGDKPANDFILSRLNESLVDGVHILRVYQTGKKIGLLSYLDCRILMTYDAGVPTDAVEKLTALFCRKSLIVPKKTKSGTQDQDIIPMIRTIAIDRTGENEMTINANICCQNPTLNPAMLVSAIDIYCPEYAPDFYRCRRIEVYDKDGEIFR